MPVTFRPATQDVFDDVETMLGPKRRPDAVACWCLTYRLGFGESSVLDAAARRRTVHEMCGQHPEPGILGYLDGEVVGWAGVARRSRVHGLDDEAAYPAVAAGDPWTIFCVRTRGGRRRKGIGQQLLHGAIDFARGHGADIVAAYPVDPAERVSPILAYPGVRAMYEREGFIEVAPAAPVPGGPSRVAMVLDLR
ncbi:GNAT family N-acetyltransferase [Gordonia humi]|nr:GNAT family N-acetyltransferase [Gordonia humi]